MKHKVCCIFNLAPHYRAPIYTLMDAELNCDFYFGDSLRNQIKLMNFKTLTGFKKIVKNKKLTKSGFIWQSGTFFLLFKPYKYYIITGSPAILSNWLLALVAPILGKKVIAWTHGMKKPATTRGELFQKFFYQLFQNILLYGNYSKNIMIQEGFKEDKLITIFNSLDYNNHIKLREKIGYTTIFKNYFKNDKPVLIYIGRIQKSKKLDYLIIALKELIKNGIDCNAVLVGKQIDNGAIHNLINENNLSQNIWLYGPCYDETIIGELLFNSDVCVSPGPVGLTAIHALTFGCPVITNDDFPNQMPEHEAILTGETGDFFINDDINSLVMTISNWINLTQFKKEGVRKKAYQIVEKNWNPNFQIRRLKNLIK